MAETGDDQAARALTMRAAHAAGRRDLYGQVDVHFDLGDHQVVAGVVAPLLAAALLRGATEQTERQDAGGTRR